MRSGCVSEAISITQLFSLRCLTQAGALTAATPAMTGGFISTTSYAKKLQSCAARQDRRGEWLALPMLLLRLLHGGTLRRSCRDAANRRSQPESIISLMASRFIGLHSPCRNVIRFYPCRILRFTAGGRAGGGGGGREP